MGQQKNPISMWRYATVGVEFIAAFGMCFAVGLYVDQKRGGGTIWPLVGAAVGFAAGMCRIVQVARQYRRDSDGKDRPS